MDLKDLIQLAETDSDKARKIFTEKFDINRVTYFEQFHLTDPALGYTINPYNQHLSIENFELFESFLRKFGHFLSDLRVICADKISFKWIEMAELICTHCQELNVLNLLNSIECEDPIENVLRKAVRMQRIARNPLQIAQAIPKLETLLIENIFIDSSSMNLTELFPNLLSLDLITVGITDPSIIERYIPKLEHFGIVLAKEYAISLSDDDDDEETGLKQFRKLKLETIDEEVPPSGESVKKKDNEPADNQFNFTNISNALALNPQLISLHLDMDMDIQFIDFINTKLPNLQKIKFSFGSDDFTDHDMKEDVVFKCVTNASLGILGIVSPPITFQELKELYFATEASQSIIYYIKRHKQLTSLHLICAYSDDQAFTIVRALDALKDLYLIIENNVTWKARGLIQFLAECERLQTVMLMVRVDSSDQQNWRSLIAQNNIWDINLGYDIDVVTIEKIESNALTN